jgi:hypothetical protein
VIALSTALSAASSSISFSPRLNTDASRSVIVFRVDVLETCILLIQTAQKKHSIFTAPPHFISFYPNLSCFSFLIREPGGDYVKKITVRNVCSEARTVKYKLPKSKFFYMEFPTLVKLSPGMSIVLDISFRPIRMVRAYVCYFHAEATRCSVV